MGNRVRVGTQLMGCRVFTGGEVHAPQAAVVGGIVFATGGARVRTVGNESDVPTSVYLGCDLETLKKCLALELRVRGGQDVARRIREAVQPWLEGGSLSDEQQRRAEELLDKADRLTPAPAELDRMREEWLSGLIPEVEARLEVSERIHPRVTVTIGTRSTVFEREQPGPVIIEVRKIKNVTQMVAVDPRTDSVFPLKTFRHTEEELFTQLRDRLLSETEEEQ
ncbi:MAG: DUF342 domain-containing protein [Planctomycetota bacterium]|nr:MAG: DUF342 domain-containing protein [Planctomycetota bacterium]